MSGRRYELTDEQWDRVKEYFIIPNKNGRPYKNIRNTVNGIKAVPLGEICHPVTVIGMLSINVLKNGRKKEYLRRFSKIWQWIDSTSVKVHKDGTGAKKGAMNV